MENLNHIDLRTSRGKAFTSYIHELESELDQPLSVIEQTTLRNAAAVSIMLMEMRQQLVAGEKVDADLFGRLSNLLNRLLGSLGLKPDNGNGKDEDDNEGTIPTDELDEYLAQAYPEDFATPVNGRRRLSKGARSNLVRVGIKGGVAKKSAPHKKVPQSEKRR